MGWNGKDLQADYTQDAGYSDDASLERTLKYLNEIQGDIATAGDWPFLKFQLKKQVSEGAQKIDLSPQVPEAPTVQILSGGELAAGSKYKAKITFVLFDESGLEYDSIESQPSPASDEITPSDENLKIQLTNIASYDGDSDIEPITIHRRIYLSKNGGAFLYHSTIEDNDANTVTIEMDTTSTITPPEQSMAEKLLSEDLQIKAGSIVLREESIDNIQKYDPGMTQTGVPNYYARISETKIMLYPAPSSDMTLTYWVKRRPSQIFAESDRAIQLNRSLENVLDVGMNYKWMKYKQDADWTSMFELYQRMKSEAKAEKTKKGGQFSKVKVVC